MGNCCRKSEDNGPTMRAYLTSNDEKNPDAGSRTSVRGESEPKSGETQESFNSAESAPSTTKWKSVVELVSELREGDIIEFERGASVYHHYAIYLGRNTVIHLAGGLSDLSRLDEPLKDREKVRTVEIENEDLFKVANHNPCRRNNMKDHILEPSSPEFIIARAQSMLCHRHGFSPLFNNDKHFALWCRYGINFSTDGLDESDKATVLFALVNPFTNADDILCALQLGDLIEFRSTIVGEPLFEHWGVYVGKERLHDGSIRYAIVQRTGSVKKFLTAKLHDSREIAVIDEADLVKVALNGKCRVHNALDGLQKPFSSEDIVERARSMIGKCDYNLLTMNCEHFANWCRYGEAFSLQAENFLTIGF